MLDVVLGYFGLTLKDGTSSNVCLVDLFNDKLLLVHISLLCVGVGGTEAATPLEYEPRQSVFENPAL